MKETLRIKREVFKKAGGRGIEMAEAIDQLEREIEYADKNESDSKRLENSSQGR